MYRKVFVAVVCALVNRCIGGKKYIEAEDCCRELVGFLHNKQAIKQAIYCMFGFESLMALEGYNLQSNLEFKCNLVVI